MRRLLLFVSVGAGVGCSDPAVQPDASVPDARAAVLSITPDGFNFGEHELGTDPLPPALAVAVKNISPLPVDLTAIAIAGADAPDFSITTNGCDATLAADASCDLTLLFDPKGTNLRSAQLDVTTATETVSAPLRGTGIVRGIKLVFDPPSREFGNIAVGDTSASVTFTILNEAVAAAFTPSIVGDDAASFSLVSTTCNTATVPLHGTCLATLTMAPAYAGEHTASLRLSAGAAGSWGAGLTGHSIEPFAARPYSAFLGSMLIGQAEPTPQVAFEVYNVSPTDSTGTLTPTLAGPAAADFSIDSTDCATLPPQTACHVYVSLAAITRGNKVADLVITDGTSSVEAHSSLVGSAYTVFISTAPQFTATTVGQSSTKTLNVANPSDHDTGAVTLGITGSDYAILNTSTCASGIPAHDSCTVQVSFSPSATGVRTATLQASASPGSSHSVTLTGTGQ